MALPIFGIAPPEPLTGIILPIGISFFTFQAISYLVDVYTRKTKPPENLINFGMYLAAFPQLIAGPIVRYVEIEKDVVARKVTLEGFFDGLYRFTLGLGKKSIIADNLATVADEIFALKYGRTGAVAWIGALCYSMQIYFDFSGYSDMAIGIGRMLGFKYPENFEQPYRAASVTEFWRRWHMTLSRWFRDYLYISLGGNRKGVTRTLFNLVIVFALVGLWHGAAMGFIVWGLYHGIFLVFERVLKRFTGFEFKGLVGVALTFIVVTVGWVFFRADSLAEAQTYIIALTDFSGTGNFAQVLIYLTPEKFGILVIALCFAFLPFGRLNPANTQGPLRLPATLQIFTKGAVTWVLLILASANIAKNGFNPFIYFQF